MDFKENYTVSIQDEIKPQKAANAYYFFYIFYFTYSKI